MDIGTLTPAYGRDYKSKAGVLADFMENKDFVSNSFNGVAYVNREQIEEAGKKSVNVRFKKQQNVCVLTRGKDGKWK